MAPTMPVSAPLAGGSKSGIAVCGATRCRRMRCASVACWPGVATSSIRRMEPIWQDSCSKQALPGILTAWSCLTSRYQLSNDHMETLSLLSAGPQLSQRYCHVNILSALVGPIHTSTPPKVEPLHRASYCGRVFQRKCTEMAFLSLPPHWHNMAYNEFLWNASAPGGVDVCIGPVSVKLTKRYVVPYN